MDEEYFLIEKLQFFIGRSYTQFSNDYFKKSFLDYLMSELSKIGVDISKLDISIEIDDDFTTMSMTFGNDYTKHLLQNKTKSQIERTLKLDSLFGYKQEIQIINNVNLKF